MASLTLGWVLLHAFVGGELEVLEPDDPKMNSGSPKAPWRSNHEHKSNRILCARVSAVGSFYPDSNVGQSPRGL